MSDYILLSEAADGRPTGVRIYNLESVSKVCVPFEEGG